MGKLTIASTVTVITKDNDDLNFAALNDSKNEINKLLLSKSLIDESAYLSYYFDNREKTRVDTLLANFIKELQIDLPASITADGVSVSADDTKVFEACKKKYPDVTTAGTGNLPAWYFVQQTTGVYLNQIQKSSYLLSTSGSTRGPIDVKAKIWTFYHYASSKLYILYIPPTSNNFYAEIEYSSINTINFSNLFVDDRRTLDIVQYNYNRANQLIGKSLIAQINNTVYLNNSTDPLSSNSAIRASRNSVNYIFTPGRNSVGMSYKGRGGYNNTGPYIYPRGIMYEVDPLSKVAYDYNQYTFKANGIYTMSVQNAPSYNVCLHGVSISKSDYFDNKYNLVKCVLSTLQELGSIPSDAKILNPEQIYSNDEIFGGFNGAKGYPASKNKDFDPKVNARFFEFKINNTFTSTSLSLNLNSEFIKLPPPKFDENLKPIRRYIKVTKLSHETLSGLINKSIGLQKITEIIPQSFSYPFSAIIGTKIDSRTFSQVPTRTFECKLKKVLIPSNYFITDEFGVDVRYLKQPGKYQIYVGDWDGTFKLAWTNNPAWILMDLLINKRYGLGNYIESEQVDIWELYKISRWCDGVNDDGYYYGVPDSYGGIEPRHTFNAMIQDRFNIFDMINQIASVFRGHVYYMNSLITFDDDRLKPVIGEFSNLDVKDGLFNYTNRRKDEEFTAVDVSFIDEKDNYKPKLEYVEDSDAISKRGILKKEINAFGVTSRGQARRFGYHFLYQSSKENTNVTFTTDIKALLYKPGDLINIHDELINSNKNYGVIKNIRDINSNCFEVIIDKALDRTVYDDREISIFTPIAKPKFDDISTACQYVPTEVIMNFDLPFGYGTDMIKFDSFTLTNGGSTIGISKYLHSFTPFTPVGSIDVNSGAQVFTAIATVCHYQGGLFSYPLQNDTYYACLHYIKDYDINNIPSKYGHWKITLYQNTRWLGTYLDTSKKQNYDITKPKDGWGFYFDSLGDPAIKYQLPHKFYFFEHFDIAKSERKIGTDALGNEILQREAIDLTNHAFCITNFSSPKISYVDILENDRPSVETFYINSYVTGNLVINNDTYNEYTCLTLFKAGINKSQEVSSEYALTQETYDPVLSSKKDYVKDNICDLMVGSTYSLKLSNKVSKVFKIMSITENYVNEYNIMASEFNPARFQEIEENNSVDDLNTTFNALYLHNSSNEANVAEELKAPIILSVNHINKYIEITWRGVYNATSYSLFIKTPSKNSRNYIAEVQSTSINTTTNLFTYIWELPALNEVGTYTVSLQAIDKLSSLNSMYKFSPTASQTISILSY